MAEKKRVMKMCSGYTFEPPKKKAASKKSTKSQSKKSK